MLEYLGFNIGNRNIIYIFNEFYIGTIIDIKVDIDLLGSIIFFSRDYNALMVNLNF